MELTEAIKGRRSVRKFKPDPVPRDVLEGIMELALWAPSGMNRQDWFFIIVQGEKKEELKRVFSDAFNDMRPQLEKVFAEKPKIIESTKNFFETFGGAPAFIFAYAGKGPGGDWDTHSTAVAVQNLLLAAESLGLGGCPVAAFYDDELNDLLNLDGEGESVIYLAAVGAREQM